MTFAEDIEQAAQGQNIEAVVIGEFGWGSWDGNDNTAYGVQERHKAASGRRGEVLTWDEARGLLDYTYDTSHGAPQCHAMTAWTKDLVLWVGEYDGATWISSAPRNPVEHEPEMSGGG